MRQTLAVRVPGTEAVLVLLTIVGPWRHGIWEVCSLACRIGIRRANPGPRNAGRKMQDMQCLLPILYTKTLLFCVMHKEMWRRSHCADESFLYWYDAAQQRRWERDSHGTSNTSTIQSRPPQGLVQPAPGTNGRMCQRDDRRRHHPADAQSDLSRHADLLHDLALVLCRCRSLAYGPAMRAINYAKARNTNPTA